MRILVMSKEDAGMVSPRLNQDWKFISIGATSWHGENVLNLNFDDVERPMTLLDGQPAMVFDEAMARQILDFVADCDKVAIHCHAGISRSGGIGAALNVIFNGDSKDFYQLNPQVLPNALVKSVLLKIGGVW